MAAGVRIIVVSAVITLSPPYPYQPPLISLSLFVSSAYFCTTDQAACDKLTRIALHKELSPCCSHKATQALFELEILFQRLSPLCVLYMDIRVLLPMTILLIRLSPTMCVQGDCHPLGGSTRSSSDGTLNVKLGFDLPVVVHHCTGLTRSFRLNVENIRGAQWEPDPISLCSNFA